MMKILIFTLVSLMVVQGGFAQEQIDSDLLIDDFSSGDGRSILGSYWQLSSDRVMGGISLGEAFLAPSPLDGDAYILKMTGDVRLENNGGFVQVRLPLGSANRPFDASEFSGVALNVRGNGEVYYVHIRLAGSWRPWAYFYQRFVTSSDWTRVELPFEAFKSDSTRGALPSDRLVSIAVVAAKEKMRADIEVARVELYR